METFGLSIKAKASGTWQTIKPWVKVGGSWIAARIAWIKVGGNWQKSYEYEWVYTFASGEHTDVDLDALSGIDKYHSVKVIIPSNTTLVASSTSAFALKTGNGYGGTLTIENNGTILGRGGNGGNGGNHATSGGAGSAGGSAIHVECPVTIDNNGTIAGGGGGGGGGGGAFEDRSWPSSNDYAYGGGGGGGAPYGVAGGSGGSSAGGGSSATLSGHGGGGGGSWDGYALGGAGGAGGAWGNSGSNGVNGQHTGGDGWDSNGGAGGAAGLRYYNPSNHTVIEI